MTKEKFSDCPRTEITRKTCGIGGVGPPHRLFPPPQLVFLLLFINVVAGYGFRMSTSLLCSMLLFYECFSEIRKFSISFQLN